MTNESTTCYFGARLISESKKVLDLGCYAVNTGFQVLDWMKWMNKVSWMRGQQTCPLTIYFNMWTVHSDVSKQRRHWKPLSVHLWAYCTQPAHDVNDVMCVGWPQYRGLRPLLFSNSGVGSFMSHKNQLSVSVVRRDLRFFVLIRED